MAEINWNHLRRQAKAAKCNHDLPADVLQNGLVKSIHDLLPEVRLGIIHNVARITCVMLANSKDGRIRKRIPDWRALRDDTQYRYANPTTEQELLERCEKMVLRLPTALVVALIHEL